MPADRLMPTPESADLIALTRELVDDKRVIPVPELRLLLRMWHRGQI